MPILFPISRLPCPDDQGELDALESDLS